MDKITDEILLDYLDGSLTEEKAEYVKELLDQDNELKSRLMDLKMADQYMIGNMDSPSMNFTETVWNRISSSGRTSKFSLNGLLIVLAAMITVVLGSYFMTDSIIDLDLNVTVPSTVTEYVKVPQIEMPEGVNLKTVSQVLLYSISLLLLLILDKAILKPYFKRRKELLGSH